ncbi:peptide-methionine (S)-S-oxide reductase MsrA [Emticicia sp. CRIBPO]|nr:peptide-methionine (S)-S-oxide reductase MsrA [Emticicia sp. CRIBPO]
MKQAFLLFSAILVFGNSFMSCAQNKNKKTKEMDTKIELKPGTEVATLGAGCFWCVEAIFQQLEGVIKVESGYSGGEVKNPTYKQVCTGETGHAEVIQVTYDTTKINFEGLLEVFFKTHDPTTLNRQGADVGTQYRSSIFYHNEQQKETAERIIKAVDASGAYNSKIVTTLEPYHVFYVAEDYHQNYFNENGEQPYCQLVVKPKVDKFQKVFKDKLKKHQ